MKMTKLVILEPLGISKEKLLSLAESAVQNRMEITAYDDRKEDLQTLIERSKDADAVVLSNFPYRKEVIEKCPHLKMICVAFTGTDHVDVEYCKERGILVCNCAGYSTAAVADLVFGMIIDIYRKIIECNCAVREEGTGKCLTGHELEGKKFGVIGAGAIGSRVAKIADAFGCEVYAYNRSVKDLPHVSFVSLDHLLSTCDIISLHLPSTPETKNLIDGDKIRLMKPSAVFINTARGAIVDSHALAEALREGRLAGAGIDVFEMEPPIPPEHPLLNAPGVVATPHIAFATEESMMKRAEIAMDNIRLWLDGRPQNVV